MPGNTAYTGEGQELLGNQVLLHYLTRKCYDNNLVCLLGKGSAHMLQYKLTSGSAAGSLLRLPFIALDNSDLCRVDLGLPLFFFSLVLFLSCPDAESSLDICHMPLSLHCFPKSVLQGAPWHHSLPIVPATCPSYSMASSVQTPSPVFCLKGYCYCAWGQPINGKEGVYAGSFLA